MTISKLVAGAKGDPLNSTGSDVKNSVNALIDATKAYGGIKLLEPIDGVTLNVTGFYAGSTVGGGQFIYDAAKDKAEHNGGAVIAPEAIAAWDGTSGDIATLLGWSGSGTGCFVKRLERAVSLLDFGGETSVDNKIVFDFASVFAVKNNLVLIIDGLYPVSGITIGAEHRGINIQASKAPNEVSNTLTTLCGFKPFADNQEFVMQIGLDTETMQGGSIDGVCVYGDDKTLTRAALVVRRWSQGASKNLCVRNVNGLGVDFIKGEDLQFDNLRVVKVGSQSGNEGAIRFSKSPDLASNVIRFIGGRVEWVNGFYVGLSSETDSAMSHVWFINTKFEVGNVDGYGLNRASYPVFDLSNANTFWRCANINFDNVWVSQAEQCQSVFKLGASNVIRSRGLNMSTPSGGPISLAVSDAGSDIRELSITDSSVINTDGDYTSFAITSDIDSTYPIEIDYPSIYNGFGYKLSNDMQKSYITAKSAGIPSRLAKDNSSAIFSGQVMSLPGNGNTALCRLSASSYGGSQNGFNPEFFNQLVTVKFRAKKTGATGWIALYAGASYLDRIQLTDDWQWYELGGTLRSRSGQLSLNTNSSSSADAVIFVDMISVESGKKHKVRAFADATGNYESGDIVELSSSPASGQVYSKICTVSGNPATFVDMFTMP